MHTPATPPGRPDTRRVKLPLRLILTISTVATVLLTAALVHFPWAITARNNITSAVDALNTQIINGMSQELNGVRRNAEDAGKGLRIIFDEQVMDLGATRRNEVLLLAYLQSHPSISWVSLGTPDGSFFGAHKGSGGEVQMVDSRWDGKIRRGLRRIDHYRLNAGKLDFIRRETLATTYYTPDQAWYQGAMNTDGPVWSDVYTLPVSGKAGISVAIQLKSAGKFRGVINIGIALERLSLYLQSVRAGRTGTVFVMNGARELVASQDPVVMPEVMPEDSPPKLTHIAEAGYPFLEVTQAALVASGVGPAEITEPITLMEADADLGDEYFVTIAPLRHKGWVVATVIPEADFLGPINANTEKLGLVLFVFVLIILSLALAVSRFVIDQPFAAIIGQIGRVEAFDFGHVQRIHSRIREVEILSDAIASMSRGVAAFHRYLPTSLVRTLITQGMESRPQLRDATMVFTDIEGFTSMAEGMTPERLVQILNEYFTAVTPAIEAHGGVITQYQGDAIVAVYNVPSDDPDHASHAAHTALAIQRVLSETTFTGGLRLNTRIGINTGPVVAASVGSQERVTYTVHGDAVNLAARLEAMNKQHGTRILLSESTVARLNGQFNCRRIGEMAVRGKQQDVVVYTLAA